MDFQLNPNAAEFVPVSPTPIISTRMDHLDAPIAGSPLKQTPVMDDITIPSRREFENEVRNRPCEIEEKSSCTNGQLLGEIDECVIQKPSTTTPIFNPDESEISSTKAEFGDESSFLTASEFQRTGVSNLDGSYTDSYGGFEDSDVDPMTKSFGPGDFMALGNPVDLNAVHDLPDDDLLMTDENGPQDLDKMNFENIQASEPTTESAESQYKEDTNFDPFSNNQNPDILESSSPVLSPSSPKNQLNFGSQIDDNRVETPISTLASENIETDNVKLSADHEISSPSPQPIYDDTNVTSKLLEMDLEDRGSQDCEFEKCNEKFVPEEKFLAEEEKFVAEEEKFVAEEEKFVDEEEKFVDEEDKFVDEEDKFVDEEEKFMPDEKTDGLVDFLLSQVTRVDFSAFPVKESLPIDSPHVEEVDKLAETFSDLHTNDDSSKISTAVPEVPILLNPLDLHIENTQNIQDDVTYDDSPDYQIAKAPESPIDILSPFPEHEQKKNPFETAEFGSPVSFGDPQDRQPMSHDFEEKHTIFEPEIVETKQDIVETKPEIVETKEEIVETKLENIEKPEIPETHLEIVESPEIEKAQAEIAQIPPELEENVEISSEPAEVTSTLKLSESLQEFTGLEEQLNPENSTKISNGPQDNLLEIHSEEAKIDEVSTEISKPAEPIVEDVAKVELSKEILEEEKKMDIPLEMAPEKTEKSEIITAVAAAAVATAAAAGTVAATATKVTKSAKPLASKTATKSATSTKPPANKSTPTSPTKPAISARTSSLNAAKKTASTSSAPRPTKLETGKSTAASKPPATASKSTTSAPKPSGRLSVSSPRTKPAASTISKTATSSIDKKPTTNGEATKSSVSASKVTSTAAKVTGKPLVKSSTTRASSTTTTTTTSATRARPTSSTVASSSATKPQSKTTTGTIGTTTQRPKTAPLGTSTTSTAKTRVSSVTKAPINDKQIKETANKQISSSRTSTTTTASKNTRTSVSSSTTTATRRLTASKPTSTTNATATQAIPPPIRKPAPITRPGGKTVVAAATTNVAAPTPTTNGKNHVTKTSSKTKVVVQNGVCTEAQETKIVTSTTSNNEDEDVPKKDLSPVDPPTDNQLIIAAD